MGISFNPVILADVLSGGHALSLSLSLREIFSVLDLMKMDMANFAVSYVRPHLMKQSVQYERSKFQEFLDRHPSEGSLFPFLDAMKVKKQQ